MSRIEIIEAERDDSVPFRYFAGQSDDHVASYPIPHEIDAFAAYGTVPQNVERCKIMLRAGLVPDSIGKCGSPHIGVMRDNALAEQILAKLEIAST